jgi:hypothetical protein
VGGGGAGEKDGGEGTCGDKMIGVREGGGVGGSAGEEREVF